MNVLQDRIYDRVTRALAGRPRGWLAERSGVNSSTLSSQLVRRKVTMGVLEQIAPVLGHRVAWFLEEDAPDVDPATAKEALRKIKRTFASSTFDE
jgi:phosphohistidine phosphatase SixA